MIIGRNLLFVVQEAVAEVENELMTYACLSMVCLFFEWLRNRVHRESCISVLFFVGECINEVGSV